jgi:hypothetical protein
VKNEKQHAESGFRTQTFLQILSNPMRVEKSISVGILSHLIHHHL